MYNLDKVIIGKKGNRGRGAREFLIKELLEDSFVDLRANIVELKLYD